MSIENDTSTSFSQNNKISRQRTISFLSASSLGEDQIKFQSADFSLTYSAFSVSNELNAISKGSSSSFSNSGSSESMESRKRTCSTLSLINLKEDGEQSTTDDTQTPRNNSNTEVRRKCYIPAKNLKVVTKSSTWLERCYLFITHNFLIICQAIVLFVTLLVVFKPYWELDETPLGLFHSGLWRFCLFTVKCDYFHNHATTKWLLVTQVAFILNLMFQSLCLISITISRCFNKKSLKFLVLSISTVSFLISAGLLNLIGTIIYGFYQGYEDPKELYWCYWVVFSLNFILFFLCIHKIKCIHRNFKSRTNPDDIASSSNMKQSTNKENHVQHLSKRKKRSDSLSQLLSSESTIPSVHYEGCPDIEKNIDKENVSCQNKVSPISPNESSCSSINIFIDTGTDTEVKKSKLRLRHSNSLASEDIEIGHHHV